MKPAEQADSDAAVNAERASSSAKPAQQQSMALASSSSALRAMQLECRANPYSSAASAPLFERRSSDAVPKRYSNPSPPRNSLAAQYAEKRARSSSALSLSLPSLRAAKSNRTCYTLPMDLNVNDPRGQKYWSLRNKTPASSRPPAAAATYSNSPSGVPTSPHWNPARFQAGVCYPAQVNTMSCTNNKKHVARTYLEHRLMKAAEAEKERARYTSTQQPMSSNPLMYREQLFNTSSKDEQQPKQDMSKEPENWDEVENEPPVVAAQESSEQPLPKIAKLKTHRNSNNSNKQQSKPAKANNKPIRQRRRCLLPMSSEALSYSEIKSQIEAAESAAKAKPTMQQDISKGRCDLAKSKVKLPAATPKRKRGRPKPRADGNKLQSLAEMDTTDVSAPKRLCVRMELCQQLDQLLKETATTSTTAAAAGLANCLEQEYDTTNSQLLEQAPVQSVAPLPLQITKVESLAALQSNDATPEEAEQLANVKQQTVQSATQATGKTIFSAYKKLCDRLKRISRVYTRQHRFETVHVGQEAETQKEATNLAENATVSTETPIEKQKMPQLKQEQLKDNSDTYGQLAGQIRHALGIEKKETAVALETCELAKLQSEQTTERQRALDIEAISSKKAQEKARTKAATENVSATSELATQQLPQCEIIELSDEEQPLDAKERTETEAATEIAVSLQLAPCAEIIELSDDEETALEFEEEKQKTEAAELSHCAEIIELSDNEKLSQVTSAAETETELTISVAGKHVVRCPLHDYVPKEQRFVCGVTDCQQHLASEDAMRLHLVREHSYAQSFKCPHCKRPRRSQVSAETIMEHLAMHKRHLYQCGACALFHPHRSHIEQHIRNYHVKELVDIVMHRRDMSTELRRFVGQTRWLQVPAFRMDCWCCNICSFQAPERDAMLLHVQQAHGHCARYICPYCCEGSDEDMEVTVCHILRQHAGKRVQPLESFQHRSHSKWSKKSVCYYCHACRRVSLGYHSKLGHCAQHQRYRCAHCTYGAATELPVKQHMRLAHAALLGLALQQCELLCNELPHCYSWQLAQPMQQQCFELCCAHCAWSSALLDELRQHWRSAHAQLPFYFSIKPQLACPQCIDYEDDARSLVLQHLQQQHDAHYLLVCDARRRQQCGYCGFSYANLLQLAQHISDAAHQLNDVKQLTDANLQPLLLQQPSAYFQCNSCRVLMPSISAMSQHGLEEHSPAAFYFQRLSAHLMYHCYSCQFASSNELDTLRHMLTHYKSQRICSYCHAQQSGDFAAYIEHCYAAHSAQMLQLAAVHIFSELRSFLQQILYHFSSGLLISKSSLRFTRYKDERLVRQLFSEFMRNRRQT
ncbi:uncharacterized protein LOC108598320 [Drosophila busckii]|nr:uncharacterized protein LOC108598320 [Drosophila busckii]